uniref:Globin family profile domain-containing protein n=2 Tax=Acrobeloides nanus TaxID=290746 RepID=A0A914DZJ9_9BILA
MSQVITYAKSLMFPSKQDSLDKQISSKPIEDYYDKWEANTDEKELIKLSWSNDFDFLFTLGSNIYIYIFEHNPKTRELFPGIHQYGENWQESKEFRKQALNFVQTLSFAVKNIYHMDEVADYLYKIGERHVKFADRGFKPEYWNIFQDAMEVSLEQQIASLPNFNESQQHEAIRVWRRLALYLITHLKRGYFERLNSNKDIIL